MNGNVSREETIFHAAMELANAEARAAYLQQACGGDDPLRQRVEMLIWAAEQAGDFLEQPAAGVGKASPSTAAQGLSPIFAREARFEIFSSASG